MHHPPDTPPPDDGPLAGFDPDTVGLDLAGIAMRDEPSDAELYGLDIGPDDDGQGDWVTGVVLAGPGEAFADGGPLGQLPPDGALAGLSGRAYDAGLGGMSDDALVGLLHASRRVSAWQSGIELAAVAELDHRRLRDAARPGWSKVSEHVAAELAAALVLTGRSADLLLGLARDLARLPAVLRALLAGEIDRARAAVFAAELAALSGRDANVAAAAFLPEAPGLTTGQLRNALRALVLLLDPAAVRRRMTKARADARVEAWQESSGNLALAGRELDPADAAAADRRITAIAQALKDHGAAGTLDQLRAAVFTALLAGQHPDTLLPAPDPAGDPEPAGLAGGGTVSCRAADVPAGGLAALTGTVHLTLPAATFLGQADLPGEAAGLGPLDAWTSRRLANRLAASPHTRWQVTLLHPDGTAAAHATARGRPGPRAGPAACRGWITRLRYTPVSTGSCPAGCGTPGYRPAAPAANLIRARNRTCTFPGCRRPAAACDLDHTIPWDQGGPTCPCNLGPLCRKHHRTKQAPGWTLTQPEPGTLEWTTPHGRRYTVRPSTYLS